MKALDESIQKWIRNCRVTVEEMQIGANHCPLCQLHLADGCVGCPVAARSGKSGCRGTPYDVIRRSWGRKYTPAGRRAIQRAARAYLKFLLDLRHPGLARALRGVPLEADQLDDKQTSIFERKAI